MALEGKVEVFKGKNEAYEHIFAKYKYYQIGAVDDHYFTNRGFANLIQLGGKTYHILNALDGTSWGLTDYKERKIANVEYENSAWGLDYEWAVANDSETYIESLRKN